MHLLSFLLSSIAFLLIAFALHLLYSKWGNILLNRLLALQFLARFAQIAIFLLMMSGNEQLYPIFQKLLSPFFFALPACTYLYVRGFVAGTSKLKARDYWHFMPALLALLHVLPWPWLGPFDWAKVANEILVGGQLSITSRTGLFPAYAYALLQSILILGYLAATWHVLLSSSFIRRSGWDLNKIWLFFYIMMATFFKLMSFIPLLFSFLEQHYLKSPIFLGLTCSLLLFMMLFVLYQPRILYGYVLLPKVGAEARNADRIGLAPSMAPTRNKLTLAQQELYAESIKKWMDEARPFLAPDFQIMHLAQQLRLPVHHCSLTINK